MTVIRSTPSPKTFADAWATEFAKALETSAGKDRRLSVTEARRMGERKDGGEYFSDNAQAYLRAKGQATVSVDVLVTAAREYALRSATTAAGADGKLSLEDGKKLASDLRDDFMYLRGKVPVVEVPHTPEQLKADAQWLALQALDNGVANKWAVPPSVVKGRKPIFENVPHPQTGTTFDGYLANGKVYVSLASHNGPNPNVGWYEVGALPKAGSGRAALRAAFESVTRNLWHSSESDSRVKFVTKLGAGNGTNVLDVVNSFQHVHDQNILSMYDSKPSTVAPLRNRPVTEGNAYAWLDARAKNWDPGDVYSDEAAARWSQMRDVVRANLTNLKLFKFGDVQVSYFIVGKTKDGDLAGFFTGAIET